MAPNILLAGTVVADGEGAPFEARWAGAYRLYDAAGRPSAARFILDGRAAEGPVRLETGPHAVRLAQGAGPLYLLPANLAQPVAVLPAPLQEPLFDQAHEF